MISDGEKCPNSWDSNLDIDSDNAAEGIFNDPQCQDEMLERRLVAAALAYAAVVLEGDVQVALKDSTVTLGCFSTGKVFLTGENAAEVQ